MPENLCVECPSGKYAYQLGEIACMNCTVNTQQVPEIPYANRAQPEFMILLVTINVVFVTQAYSSINALLYTIVLEENIRIVAIIFL